MYMMIFVLYNFCPLTLSGPTWNFYKVRNCINHPKNAYRKTREKRFSRNTIFWGYWTPKNASCSSTCMDTCSKRRRNAAWRKFAIWWRTEIERPCVSRKRACSNISCLKCRNSEVRRFNVWRYFPYGGERTLVNVKTQHALRVPYGHVDSLREYQRYITPYINV